MYHNSVNVSALLNACDTGNHHEVTMLLNSGSVHVDCCDRTQWTGLHYACKGGHVAVVALLLDRGCNKEAMNIYGTTPLHLARYILFTIIIVCQPITLIYQ